MLIELITMRRSILICLLLVFSINASADCSIFKVITDDSTHLGYGPNQLELCTLTLLNNTGTGTYKKIAVVYFIESLLPQTIEYCLKDNEGYFVIDNIKVPNIEKEFNKYGISAALITISSQFKTELLNEGNSFKISSQSYHHYSGESDLFTYVYSWNVDSKNYLLSENKRVSKPKERIKEMEASISSGDFKTLAIQLAEFDYGNHKVYFPNKLPNKFTKNLWVNLHKKTLKLYKDGNKKEAALLIENILNSVIVSPPDKMSHLYNGRDFEYNYSYAIEAMLQNPKLLIPLSDCAFFLEQGDRSLPHAASVFKSILKDYPNRVVTYLNLADTFWKLEQFEKAKKHYQTYVEMLEKEDKENVVPDYVYKRLDQLKRGE